ncbi:tol-pal system-associated acyl-CoA thioesterase [Oceanicoccus sp. KOV_DT_Chl]|uniref:tol-pal system-associated acyl-CoA thioesterase n=1 Tax=Oceanicoccus sp. KOV_DT_Chl TaxID=1904639 RepID=UPI000C7A25EA|nr:tol-pal system-associated acyl-CoA thioesterase [Oceanicoccus sp. KOV_DT_Chl]
MAAVFEWPLRVYIEDTDAGGIVYYVNYLKFIERARTEYLRNLGFGKDFIFNNDLMFVVHSINCAYQKPARLDDQLLATASIVEMGKTFMLMEQKVYRPSGLSLDNELLFTAAVKVACVNRNTIKPQRIPQPLLLALQ